MINCELLAPAGSFESLKAAVLNGTDAVYLGGSLFNARASATNFNDHELEEAVDFLATDEFSITFTQTTNNPFVFDTLILFFDEV